jgi:Zinc finger, C2H2 type
MDNKTFQCEICGKSFNTKAHLKQHLNKKYKCVLQQDDNSLQPSIMSEYANLTNLLKQKEQQIVELKKKNKKLTSDNMVLLKQFKSIQGILNNLFIYFKNNNYEQENISDDGTIISDVTFSSTNTSSQLFSIPENKSFSECTSKDTFETMSDISSKFNTPDIDNINFCIDNTNLTQFKLFG